MSSTLLAILYHELVVRVISFAINFNYWRNVVGLIRNFYDYVFHYSLPPVTSPITVMVPTIGVQIVFRSTMT